MVKIKQSAKLQKFKTNCKYSNAKTHGEMYSTKTFNLLHFYIKWFCFCLFYFAQQAFLSLIPILPENTFYQFTSNLENNCMKTRPLSNNAINDKDQL